MTSSKLFRCFFALGSIVLPLRAWSGDISTPVALDATATHAMIASGAKVIDVRRSDEWQSTGVIPGSLLITAFGNDGRLLPDFVDAVRAQVSADAPVVVICRSGKRSAAASVLLMDPGGFRNVYNAEGGMLAWTRSGFSVTPCPNC